MTRTNPPTTAADPGRAAANSPADQLHGLPAVLTIIPGGRTWWLDLVKAREAPQPVKIGRRTFWLASEIQGFIADRVRESRAGK